MERIEFLGYEGCVRLTNGEVEVVVAPFGPRILRYGLVGGPNLFGHFPEVQLETEMGLWRAIGGHRLWVAPEANPHSYAPDDGPVELNQVGALRLTMTARTDAAGFEKSIAIELGDRGTEVSVHHRIVNRNSSAVEIAPWALTILEGGTCLIPLEPYRAHGEALLPSQALVLWPFTDLSDPRIDFEARTVRLSAEPTSDAPQKIGLANGRGWAAYRQADTIFVKRYDWRLGQTYPDFGVNTEVFVRGRFMELETLGPLQRLEPGDSVEHDERWSLVPNAGEDAFAELLRAT